LETGSNPTAPPASHAGSVPGSRGSRPWQLSRGRLVVPVRVKAALSGQRCFCDFAREVGDVCPPNHGKLERKDGHPAIPPVSCGLDGGFNSTSGIPTYLPWPSGRRHTSRRRRKRSCARCWPRPCAMRAVVEIDGASHEEACSINRGAWAEEEVPASRQASYRRVHGSCRRPFQVRFRDARWC
jgi:hypothetical protein